MLTGIGNAYALFAAVAAMLPTTAKVARTGRDRRGLDIGGIVIGLVAVQRKDALSLRMYKKFKHCLSFLQLTVVQHSAEKTISLLHFNDAKKKISVLI
jgi:hypothetical protein